MRLLLRTLVARPASALVPRTGRLTKFRQQATPTCFQCQFHTGQLQLAWSRQSRFYSSETDKPKDGQKAALSESTAEPKIPSTDSLRNLPSQRELRRSEASKRFSKAMDDLQTAVFTAGQKLNILTGYSDIETLKKAIEVQERHVQASRLAVRNAKEEYQNAINRRSASQREVNELLQRKHAWSATDLERFTQLYRSDHTNEQAERAAEEQLSQAERTADEAQDQLARNILARYHEEQIWSDKIRRASTWGTWGLMGFNVLLFIVVQLGLEPWKRRRLVGGFEEKVREVIQEENKKYVLSSIATEPATLGSGDALLVAKDTTTTEAPTPSETATEVEEEITPDMIEVAAIDETPVITTQEPEPEVTAVGDGKSDADQQAWSRGETAVKHQAWALRERAERQVKQVQEKVKALLSKEEVVLTQRELTAIAAEGVAVGVLLTGLGVTVIRYFIANR